MGMKAPVTGGNSEPREVPPAGKYIGICNGVYMLGTQPGYQGGEPKLQLMLGFELHKRKGPALDSGGRPFETSAIMNFAANVKSTLMNYAGALEGRTYSDEDLQAMKANGGFDPETLIGKACWLDVINEKKADGSIRDKIKACSALDPEDDQAPEGQLDEVYWDWTMNAECPRRISFFWDRAMENPNRKGDTANTGFLNTPPAQFQQIDPATVPF